MPAHLLRATFERQRTSLRSTLPCRSYPADALQPIPRSTYRDRLLAFLSTSKDTEWIGVGWSLGALIILEAALAAGSPLHAIVSHSTWSGPLSSRVARDWGDHLRFPVGSEGPVDGLAKQLS